MFLSKNQTTRINVCYLIDCTSPQFYTKLGDIQKIYTPELPNFLIYSHNSVFIVNVNFLFFLPKYCSFPHPSTAGLCISYYIMWSHGYFPITRLFQGKGATHLQLLVLRERGPFVHMFV